MKPLIVHARGRALNIMYTTLHKGFGHFEVTLHSKNRESIYIFRKEAGDWRHVYGILADDIREACIDSIWLHLDKSIVEMFYHEGKRQVVEIRPKPKGLWHVFVNHIYVASITSDGKKWEYHFEEESSITNDHMTKYIGMISLGKIRWVNRDGRG